MNLNQARQTEATTDVAPLEDVQPPEASSIVNDSKGELCKSKYSASRGKCLGTSHRLQGANMTIDEFARLITKAQKVGDRQPLRDALWLMRRNGLTPKTFADLGEGGIADLARKPSSDGETLRNAFYKPSRAARAILFALSRLHMQLPNAGLPSVTEPSDTSLRTLEKAQEPYFFRQQYENWRLTIHARGAEIGKTRRLTTGTADDYVRSARTILAACCEAGLSLTPSLGMDEITRPDVVDLWIPIIKNRYSETGIAPLIGGIKRIAADVLGPAHANVVSLRAVVRRHFAPAALDAGAITKAQELSDPQTHPGQARLPTIWDAPRLMAATANEPGLRPLDREVRLAAALAAQLLVDSPGLKPAALAAFDLNRDVQGQGLQRRLARPDPIEGKSWEPLSTEAGALLDALLAFREKAHLSSTFLFPRRCGHGSQEVRVAMKKIISGLSRVLGRHVTTIDVRDAVMLVALDAAPEAAAQLAAACGHKDARPVERRYRALLDRPNAANAGVRS